MRATPPRRRLIPAPAATVAASVFPLPLLAQGRQPRIVVIGGGFAGATAARFLKRVDPRLDVTLGEPNPVFAAWPVRNEGIASLGDLRAPPFRYGPRPTPRRRGVAPAADAIRGHGPARD